MAQAKKTGTAGNFDKAINANTTAPPEADFDTMCEGLDHTVVDQLDGTWHKEPGSFIIGTIQNTYQWDQTDKKTGEVTTMYGIAVRTTCETEVKDGGDIVPCKAGSLVGVTISCKLEELLYMRPGDKVGIKAVRQVDIGGGQTVWEFQVKSNAEKRQTKMVKEAPALPPPPGTAELPPI